MPKEMAAVALVLALAVAPPAHAQSILPPVGKQAPSSSTEAQTPPPTTETPSTGAQTLPAPTAAQTPPADGTGDQMRRGRSRQATREMREAARAAEMFADAGTTFAEIVNHTIADRPSGVRLGLAAARGDLARLRKLLNEESFTALETRMGEMEAAERSGNLTATALAATEAFKILAVAINPQLRRSPLELSLQTYSAFKLVVLASANPVDWTAVSQAAKESEKLWISLRRMVREPNLRVLLAETQFGVRDAAARNDAAGLRLAARTQIAAFPLVREFFERFAQAMARSGGDMRRMQQQMQEMRGR